jgi:hypothetical protein
VIDIIGPEAWRECVKAGPEAGACGFHPLSKKYFFGCKNLASQKEAPTAFSLLQHARIKSTVVLSSAFVFLILRDFRQGR